MSEVLMDGSIDKLVCKNLITNEMATSLMNDSDTLNRIIHRLIKFGELVYIQQDLIVEEERPDDLTLEEEGILALDDE